MYYFNAVKWLDVLLGLKFSHSIYIKVIPYLDLKDFKPYNILYLKYLNLNTNKPTVLEI